MSRPAIRAALGMPVLSLLALASARPARGQTEPARAPSEMSPEDLAKRIEETRARRNALWEELHRLENALSKLEAAQAAGKMSPQEAEDFLRRRIARELAFAEDYWKELAHRVEMLDKVIDLVRGGTKGLSVEFPRGSGDWIDGYWGMLGFEMRWPASPTYARAVGLQLASRGLTGYACSFVSYWEAPKLSYFRYAGADPADDTEVVAFGFNVAKSLFRVKGPFSAYFGGGTGLVGAESAALGESDGAYGEVFLGAGFDTKTIDLALECRGFWARPGLHDLDATGLTLKLLFSF